MGYGNNEHVIVRTDNPELSARLLEKDKQEKLTGAMFQRSRRIKQPLVTFIDDDGYPDVLTKLKPLCLAKNFPFVISLFQTCNLLQNHLSEVQDLQNNHGWEIACHTQYHTNLMNVPLSQAEAEFIAMRDLFHQTGLNVNHLVYPQGGYTVEVKRLAAKYYRSGVSAGGGVNSYPLKTMELLRVPFGFSAPDGQNDLAFYKLKVDEAVANNSWVIFMTHCYQATHDAVQQQALSDLVDYIQSINVPIVTLNDGFDLLGNSLDVGEMTDSKHFIVDCDGTQYISDLVFKPIPKTGITNATLVTSFPKGCISTTSFVNADNVAGFPDGVGGVLITFRTGEVEALSYQLWYPHNSTKMYRRRWDDTQNNWAAWDSYATKTYVDGLNTLTVNTTMNSFSNANVITDFSWGKVTVCAINNAGSAGLPGGVGGLLVTYRFAGNGWDRQEYRKYNSNDVWERYTDAAGAWTAWQKIAIAPVILRQVVDCGSIPANSTKDVSVPYTGLAGNTPVTAQPSFGLPNGVMYTCHTTGNTIWIRLANLTASAITVNQEFTFTI